MSVNETQHLREMINRIQRMNYLKLQAYNTTRYESLNKKHIMPQEKEIKQHWREWRQSERLIEKQQKLLEPVRQKEIKERFQRMCYEKKLYKKFGIKFKKIKSNLETSQK